MSNWNPHNARRLAIEKAAAEAQSKRDQVTLSVAARAFDKNISKLLKAGW